MTVNTTQSQESFDGNGVSTVFPFNFPFFLKEDIVVVLYDSDGNGTTQLLDSDYTIPGVTWPNGGQINMDVAPESGTTLIVSRVMDLLQIAGFRNFGDFRAEVHEDTFDKIVMMLQQVSSITYRAIRIPDNETPTAEKTVVPQDRAGLLLGFGDDDELVAVDVGEAGSLVSIVSKSLAMESGVLEYDFAPFTIAGANITIIGSDDDSGPLTLDDSLTEERSYRVTSLTAIQLKESSPAGTKIKASKNESSEPTSVFSVFGRTGNVVQVINDYPASYIQNNSLVAGAQVSDALNNLLLKTDHIGIYTSAADFLALADKRIRDGAGSGFAEWGKQHSLLESINQGLWTNVSFSNLLFIGNGPAGSPDGISRTNEAVSVVNGVQQNLRNLASGGDGWFGQIYFPPAPDGTVTYDSATGAIMQHADSATAFASETATNRVVTDRQDYCFLESWHELVSQKDLFIPRGCSQNGLATYKGIALQTFVTLGVGQGYSAYGEWDITTTGYGAKWSTLSDDDKKACLADPENNLYLNEDGELVQVRYRVRTIAGAGNGDWIERGVNRIGQGISYLALQGSSETSPAWITSDTFEDVEGDAGALEQGGTMTIPICMVNRLNQGAYHKEFNNQGAATFSDGNPWYSTTDNPTSAANCFTLATNGDVASGISGRPDGQYYGAIYAAYAQDLRVSTAVRSRQELEEEYKRKSRSDEVRGWEKVPFTTVFSETQTSSDATAFVVTLTTSGKDINVGDFCYIVNQAKTEILRVQLNAVNALDIRWDSSRWGTFNRVNGQVVYVIHERLLDQRAEEHLYTDLIGDPQRIATTFSNGVQAEWIPNIPGGVSRPYDLNRKSIDTSSNYEFTTDDGASWSGGSTAIDSITNDVTLLLASTDVLLAHYTAKAYFTEDVDNAEVKHLGKVWVSDSHLGTKGSTLANGLLNKVLTGDSAANDNRELGEATGHEITPDDLLSTNVSRQPRNKPVSDYLTAPANGSPVIKALDYLTVENGKFNLQFVYKEITYDSGWADDNQFQIIDGQSTLTDTNGNTVLYGTAKLQSHCVPYFYAEWQTS